MFGVDYNAISCDFIWHLKLPFDYTCCFVKVE